MRTAQRIISWLSTLTMSSLLRSYWLPRQLKGDITHQSYQWCHMRWIIIVIEWTELNWIELMVVDSRQRWEWSTYGARWWKLSVLKRECNLFTGWIRMNVSFFGEFSASDFTRNACHGCWKHLCGQKSLQYLSECCFVTIFFVSIWHSWVPASQTYFQV